MGKRLYIGNLSFEVSDEDLGQVFSQYGEVSSAKIIKDQFNGRSKGFGFVEVLDYKGVFGEGVDGVVEGILPFILGDIGA